MSASPAGFFVLRAPLLPFSTLVEWASDLEAMNAADGDFEPALERDRARLLERLKQIAERAEVREAVFCASPTLDEALGAWLADPATPRAEGVTNILVRYLSRMAGRATPFGLFSRCGVGRLEPGPTQLAVAAQAEVKRHTRLDMHYLSALVQTMERDPAVRRTLRYFPSTSLHHVGGIVQYVEATYEGESKARSFKLVSVEASDVLEQALAAAQRGATPSAIAAAMVRADPALDTATASDFVSELIDSQLLVSELEPPITGPEPIHYVIERLAKREICPEVKSTLELVRDCLEDMDARGLGQTLVGYRTIADTLSKLPAEIDPSRLFQVDLAQTETGARIGTAVLREIEQGVALLQQIATPKSAPDLEAFRDAFRSRYESAEVPLCVVLDDELGLGFGGTSAVPSPLLDGLPFKAKEAANIGSSSQRRSLLLRRLTEHEKAGASTWELSEDDIGVLAANEPVNLPDSFFVTATVATQSPDDMDAGAFRVAIQYASLGGARMLGRFCHGDPVLHEAVRQHLREEERLEPDAVFAEIVHLPQGRIGNILCRPVLRDYEIAFMAAPGVDPEQVIGLDDLLVSATETRVHLRSRRLGRRVIPRITNAHNPESTSLSVYRFLCAVADQEARSTFAWSWGDLWDAPHLPRVTHKKLVLALETWKFTRGEVRQLKKAAGIGRYRAVQELRRRHSLPRWIAAHGGGDNFVPVDLDNVLSVENWVDMLKADDDATVSELFPGPNELAAHAPDGRYTSELVVPFISARPPSPAVALPALPTLRRDFIPGSEWLFAKIYTGSVTADAVLREVVAPLVRQRLERGIERWFFIRYGDPQNHLRLRLRGEASLLMSTILPELRELCSPWIEQGRAHRLVIDTYERELERYGGDRGMELAETIFFEDSEAVLRALSAVEGATEADVRWRLALLGMDLFFADLGLDLDARLPIIRDIRFAFAREHRVDTAFERVLGNRFRTVRSELEALLDGNPGDDLLGLSDGAAAIATRSERLAPTMHELRARFERKEITVSVASLASSLLHMHANRMLTADHRAQEMVLYDFLLRLYESRAARRRRGTLPH